MNKKQVFFIFLAMMLVVVAIGSVIYLQRLDTSDPNVSIVDSILPSKEPGSKVYVTLMAHIEEGDIYTSCYAYPEYRQNLLDYSRVLHENGYRINIQASYQFFEGVLNCDTKDMQEQTKGMNILDYLANEYDFEIDPHHSGSWDWESEYNFADTRYIGGLVTDKITNIVGLVWDYAPQFEELDACQQGNTHTDFIYCPEIISGAVGYYHHSSDFGNDDPTSGVWIPSGTEDDFLVHDPNGRMVVIGSGPHATCTMKNVVHAFENEADYVRLLLDYIDEGKIKNQLLTISVAIPQSSLFGGVQEAAEMVRMLDTIKDEENVVFASYTEIIDVWRDDYDSEPQIFLFESINPADYTCK